MPFADRGEMPGPVFGMLLLLAAAAYLLWTLLLSLAAGIDWRAFAAPDASESERHHPFKHRD